jgi:hypothetical protein
VKEITFFVQKMNICGLLEGPLFSSYCRLPMLFVIICFPLGIPIHFNKSEISLSLFAATWNASKIVNGLKNAEKQVKKFQLIAN